MPSWARGYRRLMSLFIASVELDALRGGASDDSTIDLTTPGIPQKALELIMSIVDIYVSIGSMADCWPYVFRYIDR